MVQDIHKDDLEKGYSNTDFSYEDAKEGIFVRFPADEIFYIVGRISSNNFMTGEGYIIMNDAYDTITVDVSLVEFYTGPEGA